MNPGLNIKTITYNYMGSDKPFKKKPDHTKIILRGLSKKKITNTNKLATHIFGVRGRNLIKFRKLFEN